MQGCKTAKGEPHANPHLLSLCLVLIPTAGLSAQWYPGIIHLHTQFSDGVLAPAQLAEAAKIAGAKFIIITDHYNEIDQEMKTGTPFSISLAGLVFNHGGPWGFDKYYSGVGSDLGWLRRHPGGRDRQPLVPRTRQPSLVPHARHWDDKVCN